MDGADLPEIPVTGGLGLPGRLLTSFLGFLVVVRYSFLDIHAVYRVKASPPTMCSSSFAADAGLSHHAAGAIGRQFSSPDAVGSTGDELSVFGVQSPSSDRTHELSVPIQFKNNFNSIFESSAIHSRFVITPKSYKRIEAKQIKSELYSNQHPQIAAILQLTSMPLAGALKMISSFPAVSRHPLARLFSTSDLPPSVPMNSPPSVEIIIDKSTVTPPPFLPMNSPPLGNGVIDDPAGTPQRFFKRMIKKSDAFALGLFFASFGFLYFSLNNLRPGCHFAIAFGLKITVFIVAGFLYLYSCFRDPGPKFVKAKVTVLVFCVALLLLLAIFLTRRT